MNFQSIIPWGISEWHPSDIGKWPKTCAKVSKGFEAGKTFSICTFLWFSEYWKKCIQAGFFYLVNWVQFIQLYSECHCWYLNPKLIKIYSLCMNLINERNHPTHVHVSRADAFSAYEILKRPNAKLKAQPEMIWRFLNWWRILSR